jgi:hypothetical protein
MTETDTDAPPAAQLAAALATLLSAAMDTDHTEGNSYLTASAHGRSFTIAVADTPGGGSADPLGHVKLGDRIERPRDRNREERCSVYMNGEYCSRATGHHGQHIAWSDRDGGTVVAVMVNEADTPAPTAGGDPVVERYLAGLREGQTVMSGVREKHFNTARGANCGQRDPHGRWTCTRKPGHTGVHVATQSTGYVCCDPWTTDVAPVDEKALWRGVKRGSHLTAAQAAQMARSRDRRCGEYSDHGYSCSRKSGHDGPCIATEGEREGDFICCVPYNKPWAPMTGRLSRWESPDPTGGPDEHDPCEEDIDGDKCTRGGGHDGRHVSGNGEYVLDATEEA